MRKLVYLVPLLALCLAACASRGEQAVNVLPHDQFGSSIQENVTTKAQVKALLGSVDEVLFTEADKEVWIYRYKHNDKEGFSIPTFILPFGKLLESEKKAPPTEFAILFNDNGVVAKRASYERVSDAKELSPAQFESSIQENVSTKAQVKALLGSVDAVSFSENDKEIWIYRYRESSAMLTNYIPVVQWMAGGKLVKTKEFIILFDDNGIVVKRDAKEKTAAELSDIFGGSKAD